MSTFRGIAPCRWHGRYGRVPGSTTVFHVRSFDGRYWPVLEWDLGDGDVMTCPMLEGQSASRLCAAVLDGKGRLGAHGGGAFLINEFGQVLVPSANERRQVLVGEWTGPLEFIDEDDGSVFDVYADDGLVAGDEWNGPYIGSRYNLSKHNEIYFWSSGDDAAAKELPDVQDQGLVATVRRLRPWGAVRLMVGLGGVILTKVPLDGAGPHDEEAWAPTYVGRVDFRKWFAKEG